LIPRERAMARTKRLRTARGAFLRSSASEKVFFGIMADGCRLMKRDESGTNARQKLLRKKRAKRQSVMESFGFKRNIWAGGRSRWQCLFYRAHQFGRSARNGLSNLTRQRNGL
jgi:hypothetical protein